MASLRRTAQLAGLNFAGFVILLGGGALAIYSVFAWRWETWKALLLGVVIMGLGVIMLGLSGSKLEDDDNERLAKKLAQHLDSQDRSRQEK